MPFGRFRFAYMGHHLGMAAPLLVEQVLLAQ
jgi:hypothetical protein